MKVTFSNYKDGRMRLAAFTPFTVKTNVPTLS